MRNSHVYEPGRRTFGSAGSSTVVVAPGKRSTEIGIGPAQLENTVTCDGSRPTALLAAPRCMPGPRFTTWTRRKYVRNDPGLLVTGEGLVVMEWMARSGAGTTNAKEISLLVATSSWLGSIIPPV